jgi:hypothetical protein
MTALPHLDIKRHAQDLRETWQARAIAESTGKTRAVVLIVLTMSYSSAMKTLLRVLGYRDISRPFLSSGATIQLGGKLTCDVTEKSGLVAPAVVYDSTDDLNRHMRALADKVHMTDSERVEFTAAIQRWVVADLRVNHMGQVLH